VRPSAVGSSAAAERRSPAQGSDVEAGLLGLHPHRLRYIGSPTLRALVNVPDHGASAHQRSSLR